MEKIITLKLSTGKVIELTQAEYDEISKGIKTGKKQVYYPWINPEIQYPYYSTAPEWQITYKEV